MRFQKKLLVLPVVVAMLLTGCGGGAEKGKTSGSAFDFSTASGNASKELVVSVGDEADVEVYRPITYFIACLTPPAEMP